MSIKSWDEWAKEADKVYDQSGQLPIGKYCGTIEFSEFGQNEKVGSRFLKLTIKCDAGKAEKIFFFDDKDGNIKPGVVTAAKISLEAIAASNDLPKLIDHISDLGNMTSTIKGLLCHFEVVDSPDGKYRNVNFLKPDKKDQPPF